MGSYGPNENLTLTLQEIEEYQGQGSGKPSGKYLRYYCPIHGGDNQRSLSLDPETGRFQCYSCGAWGYLREKRQEWRQANQSGSSWKKADKHHNLTPSNQPTSTYTFPKADEPPARPDLVEPLQKFQEALPGSPGEEYLKQRGIPLAVAQKYGVGYAAPGLWPNLKKYFQHGCIVFPHTNPDGEVVNLYGRAIDLNGSVPKQYRHAHLEGPRGVFNAQALTRERVFITEGSFDAISLLAAGHEACAIFGVNGLRWPWVKARLVVFGFDQDGAGEAWRDLAYQGTVLGKDVYFLPQETYASNKDLNAAWTATGQLDIGEWTETKPEASIDIGSQPHEGTEAEIPPVPSVDDRGMSVLCEQMMEGSLKESVPPKINDDESAGRKSISICPKCQGEIFLSSYSGEKFCYQCLFNKIGEIGLGATGFTEIDLAIEAAVERSAILEFDGGLDRKQADETAWVLHIQPAIEDLFRRGLIAVEEGVPGAGAQMIAIKPAKSTEVAIVPQDSPPSGQVTCAAPYPCYEQPQKPVPTVPAITVQAPNHPDSEHQIPQQGDKPQEVNKTQENGLPPEGVYQIKIVQVRARIKNFGDYAGPQARLEMKIIEGPETGKTLTDGVALYHPLETEGRRKRRVRIALRLGLISKEDFGKDEVKVNWKLLTGTCCSVEVVHKTYNGRVFPMVNNYQLAQQQ